MPQIPVIVELTKEELAKKEAALAKYFTEFSDLNWEKKKIQKSIKLLEDRMDDLQQAIKYNKHTIFCNVDFNKPIVGKKKIYNEEYDYSEIVDMTAEEINKNQPTLFD